MKILLLTVVAACAAAQTPDIGQIMARVAENQAKAQELRKSFVYTQKQVLKMVRGSGKLAREEHREYLITPDGHGVSRQLAKFDGRYQAHGKFVSYEKPGYEYKGIDIDGGLINDLSEDMTNDKESRDGIARDLFPLTAEEQAHHVFKLVRTETFRGRQVYRVEFQPKPKQEYDGWKGDALIDCEEFQPVVVHTSMPWKIPAAVRVLLGTSLHGLGFSVTYQKFGEGVWFPVSYGGEFDVRAVFFYKRTISVSMTNSDFRRADVNSSLTYVIEQ